MKEKIKSKIDKAFDFAKKDSFPNPVSLKKYVYAK